ncbi:MAG: 6-pyruvoyl-tetrahydropterin synthase-related protein [Caldilineaceae bacterium]
MKPPAHQAKAHTSPAVDRRDLGAAALIIATAALVLWPLRTPGLPNPVDFLMSVHRLDELAAALGQGILFPRFGPNLNFGYGAPLFQFYPPLASYLGWALTLPGLDSVGALKLLMALALTVGSLGVYVYARFLFQHRLAALVSGLLYLLSPYLLTVIFERGAVAESLAWGIFPWLIWALHACYAHGRRRHGLVLALTVALMMAAHIATAMVLVPGAALFITALALWEGQPGRLKPVAAALALGLGMSAFYWLPAIGELGLTRTQEIMVDGPTAPVNNVVPLRGLVQTQMQHQYAGPERFRFGLWSALLGLAGIAGLVMRRGPARRTLWLWTIAWGAVVLLQTTFSLPFWQHAPFVDFIQFPWRLYGVASFSVALLAGALFTPVGVKAGAQTSWRMWAGVGIAAVLLMVSYVTATANLTPGAHLAFWTDADDAMLGRPAMWERGRSHYPLFEDYMLDALTTGSVGLLQGRAPDDPTIRPPSSVDYMEVIASNPTREVLWAEASAPWTLRLHRPYFPGWHVYADGRRLPTFASGAAGLVTAEMPAGAYKVVATFGESPLRLLADTISILSVALWLTLCLPVRRPRRQAVTVAALALVLAGSAFYLAGPGKPGRTPVPYPAQFANGMTLLGYELPAGPLCLGDEIPLRLHWFVGQTPATDLKYFIHIATPDDADRVAQFDTLPFAGFVPATRWDAGEVLVDEQTLALETSIPPGRYQLLVGLYDPVTVQNQTVLAAPDVLPGDRLRLTELDLAACAR